MAITKIRYIGENAQSTGKHLHTVIRYVTNAKKTEGGRYIGTRNCLPDTVYEDMVETKRIFGKKDKRQAYHIIISFNEGEITPDTAYRFMDRFAKEYLKDEYECVFTVHTDTNYIHGHLIYNSVNMITGKKFRYEKGDWESQMQPLTDRLCEEFGLKTLSYDEDDVEKKRSYNRWGEKQGRKNIWSEMIRRDVDAAILVESDMDGFLKNLTDKGYEIKQNNYISVRPPGMERFRRLATLGSEYATDRIRERLEEESLRSHPSVPPKILRVNIPYHLKRTKLSGLQRRYFRRLYEAGRLKKRPYSQAWRYREDIKNFYRLQEEYLFLARHEVHSDEELLQIKEKLSESCREAGRDEQRNYRSKKRFMDLFAAAERMEQLEFAKEAYEIGDPEFQDESEEYDSLEKQIHAAGYELNQIRDLREHFDTVYKEARENRRELRRELCVTNRILKEIQETGREQIRTETIDKQKHR